MQPPFRSPFLGLSRLFHVYLVIFIFTFLLHQKSTTVLTFLFPTGLWLFPLLSYIGSWLKYSVNGSDGNKVCFTWRSTCDRCSRCASIFGCNILIKLSTKSSIIFRKFSLSPFFQVLCLAFSLYCLLALFVFQAVGVVAFPPGHWYSVLQHPLLCL